MGCFEIESSTVNCGNKKNRRNKNKRTKKKKKTVETDKKINLLLNIFNAMDSFFKNSIFHPLHQTVLTFAILEVWLFSINISCSSCDHPRVLLQSGRHKFMTRLRLGLSHVHEVFPQFSSSLHALFTQFQQFSRFD